MMVERDEVTAALDAASARFVALVADCSASDAVREVPSCPAWTVADTAAHVLTVLRRALTDRRRSGTPAETSDLNATCLSELEERDPVRLSELLRREGKRAVHVALPSLPVDLPFPFHAGATTTVVPASCVVLGELLVHGHDIAAATGKEWPIPADEAALVLRGTAELFGAWRRPAASGAVEIHLPDGPPLLIGVGAVTHQVRDIGASDVLLAFPYRRTTPGHVGLAALQAAYHPVWGADPVTPAAPPPRAGRTASRPARA